MSKIVITEEDLDAVVGGEGRDGGVAGTKGITSEDLDAVVGGDGRDGGVAGTKG